MTKTNHENDCRCAKTSCCCGEPSEARCKCGERCECERTCRCGEVCGCPAAK